MYSKTIFALCLAGQAVAACPMASDLQTGISVRQSDGTVETFKSRGTGVVEVVGIYPDDYQGYTLLGQGVYVLEYADLVDGRIDAETKSNIAFPMSAADMPLPTPGGKWTVETAGRDSYGVWAETIDITWGNETQITYGECTYRMFAGRFDYDSDGYAFQEVVHYLPELMIGILYSYKDEEISKPETYPVVSIYAAGG